MSEYRCPSCDRITVEDICPHCGVLTEPMTSPTTAARPASAVIPPPPPPPAPPAREEEPQEAEASAPEVPPPSVAPAPLAERPQAPRRQGIVSAAAQQELHQYVEEGYEVFLIAGIAAAGKTQMLDAYRHDGYLSTFVKREGLAKPTNPDELNCHPLSVGRRKVIFVDTSGENFKHLYPGLARTGEIDEADVDFLRLISSRLAGVVLLVDLGRLWDPAQRTNPEDEAQVHILTWILELMRWLQEGGTYEASRIRFQDHVNREAMRLRRRLRAPVLALFSRADELSGLPIPAHPSHAWMGTPGGGRTLLPVGEDPLLLAHHCVPELLAALTTHARHFRIDFAHSLVTDRDSGEIVDPTPCGVSLSLQWLLDPSWRWRWLPAIPTRRWIGLQRFVDEVVKRSRRWRELPRPVEVR